MNEKLKNYVEKIFEDAPKTKKAYELKEEIIANLMDKYNDLKSSGKTEEESYNIAISNIGDIGELVNTLKDGDVFNEIKHAEQRKKSAMLISIAVGLYIFSVIPPILFSELTTVPDTIGILLMFVFIGVATMILVYNANSKPKYKGVDNTMVEEFKEWKSSKETEKTMKNSVISIMWTIIVIIYFVISFAFNSWAVSWIIFLIGASIAQIIEAMYKYKS